MEIIQILLIIFALFALSRAFLRFKDNKLTRNEFMFWILLWATVIIVSFIPKTIRVFSEYLGIGRGVDLVIYVSIVLLFYLSFRLYVKIEKIEKEMTRIVRNIAIRPEKRKKKK
ncbi:DUF2304 family protein [Candidatus Woesearchaeota archaeon]|nr:DUF2304 family protein [Candidatus Woesearchaeota archaeon]